MRVLLSGDQSFIGREFWRQNNGRGIELFGLDTVASSEPNHITCDIRFPTALDSLPDGLDAVIHLAAVSREQDCRVNPSLAFDVNVTGTMNLFAAAARRGVRQFIFASSEWVYGEAVSGAEQSEEDSISIDRIDSIYALTKATAERLLYLARAQHDCAVTILRFAIVYGPRLTNWSAVEQLFFSVMQGRTIRVGSLQTARRFIHVSDLVEGIRRALGRQGVEVFNLSGPRLVPLGEIIDVSSEIVGRTVTVEETNGNSSSIRNPSSVKANTVLGWTPAITLKDGLRSLLSTQQHQANETRTTHS